MSEAEASGGRRHVALAWDPILTALGMLPCALSWGFLSEIRGYFFSLFRFTLLFPWLLILGCVCVCVHARVYTCVCVHVCVCTRSTVSSPKVGGKVLKLTPCSLHTPYPLTPMGKQMEQSINEPKPGSSNTSLWTDKCLSPVKLL